MVRLPEAPGRCRGGTRYVPVLSAELYQDQAGRLLDALQSYQDQLNTYNVPPRYEWPFPYLVAGR